MKAAWDQWVVLWDQKEHPASLAALRIALGSVLLWDLTEIWRLGLVTGLFAPGVAGGLAPNPGPGGGHASLVYTLLPPTVEVAWGFFALLWLCTLALTVGAFTRTMAVVVVLLMAQFAMATPGTNRGIDAMIRAIFLILAFSGAGRAWSVDAWWRGHFHDPVVRIGAWARYLVLAQLSLIYFSSGMHKTGVKWWPEGDFSALYFALRTPTVARYDFSFVAEQPWYLFTQLGTVGALVFEYSFPLVLLVLWYRSTPERPGRLRALANRFPLHLLWIGTGIVFHLVLHLTLELGIFPWGMLAMYMAFLDPEWAMTAPGRLRVWVSRREAVPGV